LARFFLNHSVFIAKIILMLVIYVDERFVRRPGSQYVRFVWQNIQNIHSVIGLSQNICIALS